MSNGVWVSSACTAIMKITKPTNWVRMYGLPRPFQPKIDRCLWRNDDVLHVHRLGLDHHAEHGQHHRQLVGDQLPGGAQATEQRVLVGARPAGDQDAERADAADGEHVEDAGVEVGEVGVGPERHDRDQQERADQHDQRGHLEDPLVGLGRLDVFLLQPLADLGEQLHASRTGRLPSGRGGSA